MNLFPVVILFLSIIITTFNRGFFSFPGLTMVLGLLISLLIIFIRCKPVKLRNDNLIFTLIITYSLFLFFSGGIYQSVLLPSVLLNILPILLFPIIITYLLPDEVFDKKSKILRFLFLISASLVLRILIIIASPQPMIDVFTMLKEGTQAFLHGNNPYTSVFSQVYSGVRSDYYTYWPVSFLLQIPFIYLLGDPRILLAVSDIGSAVLLYLTGGKTRKLEILVLIYLFRPNSNFIIEQSWLTPLAFFLIVLIVFLYKSKMKYMRLKEFLSGATLGLLTGIQPHYLLLLPFFLFLYRSRFYFYIFLGFTIVFAGTVIPFYVWDSNNFLADTVGFFIRPSNQMSTVPVHLSLNLNTVIYLFTGHDFPIALLGFAAVAMIAIIFYKTLEKLSFSQVLLGIILSFLSLYLLLPFSFINYYYLAGSLIILWMVNL